MRLSPAEIAEARVALATGEAHDRMVEALKLEHGRWTADAGVELLLARLELERRLARAGE